jgi:hypothetical protein
LRILDIALETRSHPSQLSAVECGRLAAPKRLRGVMCGFYGVDEGDVFNKDGLAL